MSHLRTNWQAYAYAASLVFALGAASLQLRSNTLAIDSLKSKQDESIQTMNKLVWVMERHTGEKISSNLK